MRTLLQVLSENERHQVHESTLNLLSCRGVQVDTALGRRFLREAGAEVNEGSHIVQFPRSVVEDALRVAPREFVLGARRPGWDLRMNIGDCTLVADGTALFVHDRHTGEHRRATANDWLEATRVIDSLDEVGVYTCMVEAVDQQNTIADKVRHWSSVFGNFSKHIQDAVDTPEQASWLLEVMQVIFGDQETIRRRHPLSFLLCPRSPLIIDGPYTDAYLATVGWDIPVAVMPMPLMGASAPPSLISTVVLGNCEVLAMLCLVQAAAPGTPFLYASVPAVMNPRSGRYGGGPVEHGLLGAASTEMARHYGLPVETFGLGTDHHMPGIQAGYERAMNGVIPVLSWPDILQGPGLLGGSMVLSLVQLLIDIEIFRMAKQASRGIVTGDSQWMADFFSVIQPGDHYLDQPATARAIREGEWYLSKLGVHDSYEGWAAAGKPALLDQVRQQVDEILVTHRPLPFEPEIEDELSRILKRARTEV